MDKEGAELVDKALALKPDYALALMQKAIVLLHQKSDAKMALVELKMIPAYLRTCDWYLVEGDVYYEQGNVAEAISAWKESIRLQPENPEARYRLFLIRRQPQA